MAAVDVVSGSQLLVMVGNGASPEVFAHPCLINTTRGITFTATMTENTVPDCDDPDAAAWIEREKDTKSVTIQGAGLLDVASEADYFDWFDSPDTKNVKFKVNKTGGDTFSGKFHLSEFAITGARKQKSECTLTLVSDGAVARVTNS